MSVHYLLDGYNIIHKMPQLASKDLPDARQGLIRFIESYSPQGAARNQITVIFDGQGDVCSWSGERSSIVNIFFTAGQTADDQIKKLVSESKNPKTIIVVSDDRGIQTFVSKLGARVSTVAQFLGKAQSSPPSASAASRSAKEAKSSRKLSNSMEHQINKELEQIWLNNDDSDT